MKPFKDNEGRSWLVSINVNAIKRVRGVLSIDLYGLVDEKFQGLAKLLADPITLVDVVYVLCREEKRNPEITDEDFGRSMAGDTILRAKEAFLEELIDFFPDPRVRAGIRGVVQASRKVTDRLIEHGEMMLNQIDPDSEAKKLIDAFGRSPASSESIPDPSPSENSI